LQLEISDLTTNYNIVVIKFTEFERRISPKESIKERAYSAINAKRKLKFKGKYYNYKKIRYRAKDYKALKKDFKDAGKSLSIGLLPIPIRGRSLSLNFIKAKIINFIANAKYAIE